MIHALRITIFNGEALRARYRAKRPVDCLQYCIVSVH